MVSVFSGNITPSHDSAAALVIPLFSIGVTVPYVPYVAYVPLFPSPPHMQGTQGTQGTIAAAVNPGTNCTPVEMTIKQ